MPAGRVALVRQVGSDGASYRQAETYSAFEDLYVTERGFAEGRTVVGDPSRARPRGRVILSDPERLVGLTTLYAELVNSDAVKAIVLREGPIPGAARRAVPREQGRPGLPILR